MRRKWTQSLQMHLNGGSKYSTLVYRVLCDGSVTNITRTRSTGGSPKYLLTGDVFVCGGDEFDALKAKPGELEAWLEAHNGPGSDALKEFLKEE